MKWSDYDSRLPATWAPPNQAEDLQRLTAALTDASVAQLATLGRTDPVYDLPQLDETDPSKYYNEGTMNISGVDFPTDLLKAL